MHAAELIKELNPKTAYAGLMEDWSSTSGKIIHNYEPYLEDYTFLASSWAHPVLKIDDVFYDCYITGNVNLIVMNILSGRKKLLRYCNERNYFNSYAA